ncbi:MAG TPA: hypothetical protein VMH40_07445 [Myxococcaceae bacterium]|nr:hypothetical protein [Myxococcaceae bacterium]
MRTLLGVLLLMLGADAGSLLGPGRATAYTEARRSFARAFGSGAFDEARQALVRQRAAAPGRVDLGYDLACVEARAGRIDAAFGALGALVNAGLAIDPSADADLNGLHGDPRWAALLARFSRGRASPSAGRAGPPVPAELAPVEDLAVDRRGGTAFVSSVRTGEVWRRVDGSWRRWAHPAPAGQGALALGLDAGRRVLHVGVGAIAQAAGFRKADEGQSALVTLGLEDGRELARHVPPEPGPHLLSDLTVGPDGTVLVSDALAGTVYRLAPGQGALQPLFPPHTFLSPQTPALGDDGRSLYLPDHALGLFVVPLAGGTPEPVSGPEDLVTGGIDGLAPAPGGLVAVQNGIVENRIVRLWLSPDGRRITRWEVLSRGPGLGEPTHVVRTAEGVVALVDSGWNRFGDDGAPRPGAPRADPRLVALDLR